MGSGFKDWAAGDVLTAADVDGYLMRQTVMTFADASARDTALSGVLDEGMVAYLEDVNALTVYNGSAWVAVIDSDVLTVDTANDRVGINDSTPSYALDVTGDINATGDLKLAGDSMPRGLVVASQRTSSTALTTSSATIESEVVSLVAGREYLIMGFGNTFATSTTMVVKAQITVDGTAIQTVDVAISATLDEANISTFTVYTAPSTSSFTIAYIAQTSTGTSFVRGYSTTGGAGLAIIDIGD